MKPYIQTYSVIAGTTICNANCPFCISKITPKLGMDKKLIPLNYRNLIKGGKLAKEWGASTALITGKGEPTLYPEQVTNIIKTMDKDCLFNLIELQTNGILILKQKEYYKNWYDIGLTTVAISAVDFKLELNKEVYSNDYNNLKSIISFLHEIGITVRLTIMLVKNGIDSINKFKELINFCKENKVEQLTVRDIYKFDSIPLELIDSFNKYKIWYGGFEQYIRKELEENGTKISSLIHGASVYDYKRQNICVSNCLTQSGDNNIRQLIYFPDGHIRYDWQYEGAILI